MIEKYNLKYDSYYNDVESLLYDELSSSTFFERYGTHVIAEGVFGGKIEINYGLISKEKATEFISPSWRIAFPLNPKEGHDKSAEE